MNVVWISLAALGAILMVVAVGRFAWNLRPQPGIGGQPITPLERLGWIGLGITTVVGLGLATLIIFGGATAFHEDATSRTMFWILLVSGIGVWMASWTVIKRRSGGPVVDERDRAILARSLSVESVIVLVSLVAWTVTLTEVYWEEGAIPIAYLQLLFWSTFIGGAFGRSLGIVMGYRREITVDA